MKRYLPIFLLLLCVPSLSYGVSGAGCSPTTPVAQQSRTGMKHRAAASRTVAAHTATIHDMLLQWPNPANVDRNANSPIDPRETQAFTIQGDVWIAKIEGNDCDIHLELSAPGMGQDADRVIVEIPQDPGFTQPRNAILQALLDQGAGDLTRKKSIKLNESIPVEVTGLAFFDAFHFSAANPKRGHGHGSASVGVLWELHPVTKLTVLTGGTPPQIRALVADSSGSPGEALLPHSDQGPAGSTGDASHFSFAVSAAFLKSLESADTILPTFDVRLGGHSKIHPVESDCEMHVAAALQGQLFGFPTGVVIEPPNLCMIDPNGDESDEVDAWLAVFDGLQGKNCKASGFPRIFTEHVTGGSGASNPDHVFELHPAVSVSCDGEKHDFTSFVKIFPGMRAISPKTAASCIANRKLDVMYDKNKDRYLFRENGGTCGNFAELAIGSVIDGTIRPVKDATTKAFQGGHSAIARVSADGETTSTLKIYTLEGSEIDRWLAGAANPIVLHGLITYDYFSFIKVLHHPGDQEWNKPETWTEVPFPLAFVSFGESANQAATPPE